MAMLKLAHRDEQRHRCQHRRAQREDNLPVGPEISGAIDPRGLHQRVRQARDVGPDNNHVEAGEHRRDDVHQEGVPQP